MKNIIFFLLLASTLSAAKLEINEDEIWRQEESFSSKVPFGQAYFSAIMGIFNNGDDNESLLALVTEKYPDKEQRDTELSRIMDDQETIIKMLTASDPVAPRGENINEYWIFTLQMSKSDHIFYAIVSRNDPLLNYNYGFN